MENVVLKVEGECQVCLVALEVQVSRDLQVHRESQVIQENQEDL